MFHIGMDSGLYALRSTLVSSRKVNSLGTTVMAAVSAAYNLDIGYILFLHKELCELSGDPYSVLTFAEFLVA